MYIRFTTTYRDERGDVWTGGVQALGCRARQHETFEHDH